MWPSPFTGYLSEPLGRGRHNNLQLLCSVNRVRLSLYGVSYMEQIVVSPLLWEAFKPGIQGMDVKEYSPRLSGS